MNVDETAWQTEIFGTSSGNLRIPVLLLFTGRKNHGFARRTGNANAQFT
jgi:hypothetical protein